MALINEAFWLELYVDQFVWFYVRFAKVQCAYRGIHTHLAKQIRLQLFKIPNDNLLTLRVGIKHINVDAISILSIKFEVQRSVVISNKTFLRDLKA